MVRAIRGAITVQNNDAEEILQATKELLEAIIASNNINEEDVIDIIFTLTPDLNAVFPARAAREIGFTDIPLMCMSEIPVNGALEKCVRILLTLNTEKSRSEIRHIYLKDAKTLRPDLISQ